MSAEIPNLDQPDPHEYPILSPDEVLLQTLKPHEGSLRSYSNESTYLGVITAQISELVKDFPGYRAEFANFSGFAQAVDEELLGIEVDMYKKRFDADAVMAFGRRLLFRYGDELSFPLRWMLDICCEESGAKTTDLSIRKEFALARPKAPAEWMQSEEIDFQKQERPRILKIVTEGFNRLALQDDKQQHIEEFTYSRMVHARSGETSYVRYIVGTMAQFYTPKEISEMQATTDEAITLSRKRSSLPVEY